MQPVPIYRSLWKPVTWMGMERLPGALWVLGNAMLAVTGLMYAGAYAVTVLVVAAAAVGGVGLAKCAEKDPAFFHVLFRYLRYRAVYPARVTRIATTLITGRQQDGGRK